jgi:hypothetical protein
MLIIRDMLPLHLDCMVHLKLNMRGTINVQFIAFG